LRKLVLLERLVLLEQLVLQERLERLELQVVQRSR
jgi:hypothetical protein